MAAETDATTDAQFTTGLTLIERNVDGGGSVPDKTRTFENAGELLEHDNSMGGLWSDFAAILDRRAWSDVTENDDVELVRVIVPGWFANLNDNDALRDALIRATDWDGHDAGTARAWAIRNVEQDEGKGAYCFTGFAGDLRGHLVAPGNQYGMVWPARSCVRLIDAEGTPQELDTVELDARDAHERTDGDVDWSSDRDWSRAFDAARDDLVDEHTAAQPDFDADAVRAELVDTVEQYEGDDAEDAVEFAALMGGFGGLKLSRDELGIVGDEDTPEEVQFAANVGASKAVEALIEVAADKDDGDVNQLLDALPSMGDGEEDDD